VPEPTQFFPASVDPLLTSTPTKVTPTKVPDLVVNEEEITSIPEVKHVQLFKTVSYINVS
jgi:hypothetical protein